MPRRCVSFAKVVLAVVLYSCGCLITVMAEHRPIEGKWIVEGSRGRTPRDYPPTYHVLVGDELSLRFSVDPGDLDLYYSSTLDLALPKELNATSFETAVPGETLFYRAAPKQAGEYKVVLRIDSADQGFTLTYPVTVVVHSDLSSIEEAVRQQPPPGPLCPDPAGIDADPGNSVRTRELAPANYAHVYGLALTYACPGNRSYTLRGLKLELREGDTVLATVHTADPFGEGRCETDFNDYVTNSDNIYHHVTNSGSFDFGNIYVGPSGKTLIIREIFQFYAGASGTAADGAHRFTTEEYGTISNSQVYLDWEVTFSSGSENVTWLKSETFTLSASNGSYADEAQHVQIDGSRMYHFFTECAGFYDSTVIRFIIDLDDIDDPYCEGEDIYLNAATYGYLQYPYTDTIRHEYAHSFHWRMRGGSYPPFNSGGSTNHGGCNNPNSADSLMEGYADYVPTIVYWTDGNFDWVAGSWTPMNYCTYYCTSVPDDRDEWAVARALWQSGNYSGAPDAFFGCSFYALNTWDPDYVQDYFNGIVAACSNDHETWEGFWCSHINFDTTPPDNPLPIACTTDPNGWTNDPTWSWLEPNDDLSGAEWYSIEIVSGTEPVLPDTIAETDNLYYHPSYLPSDGPCSFSIRARDRAENWNSSFTSRLIYLDRVAPGLPTGLYAGTPPSGDWSANPDNTFAWTVATDDRSGLDGYSWVIDPSPTSIPDTIKDIEENVLALPVTFSTSAYGQYFLICSKDNAGNWCGSAASLGPYFIDTVPPDTPTGFFSSTNPGGVWSNNTEVVFLWDPAPDEHSGVDGYSICSDTLVCIPPETKMMDAVTSTTVTMAHSDSPYYASLRAVDRAANWGGYSTYGPFYIDTVPPGMPGGGELTSSHPLGLEGCTTGNPNFFASWNPAYDGNSGIGAYSYAVTLGGFQRPPEADMLPAGATTVNLTLPYSSQYYIFTIMAKDAAGNWGDFSSWGPFFSDRPPLQVGDITLSLPTGMPGFLTIDWASTGEAGYSIEWVTEFDTVTPDDWTDNAGYKEILVTTQNFMEVIPVAPVVYYRVRGRNACGVTSN